MEQKERFAQEHNIIGTNMDLALLQRKRHFFARAWDGDTCYNPVVNIYINWHRCIVAGFAYGKKNDGHAVYLHLTDNHHNLLAEVERKHLYDWQLLDWYKRMTRKYGKEFMMHFVIAIFNHVHKHTDLWLNYKNIIKLCMHFNKSDNAPLYAIITYLAMMSEYYYVSPKTNKPSMLKKRIKFVALYQIIELGWSPKFTAKYSKHKGKYKLLDLYNSYVDRYSMTHLNDNIFEQIQPVV